MHTDNPNIILKNMNRLDKIIYLGPTGLIIFYLLLSLFHISLTVSFILVIAFYFLLLILWPSCSYKIRDQQIIQEKRIFAYTRSKKIHFNEIKDVTFNIAATGLRTGLQRQIWKFVIITESQDFYISESNFEINSAQHFICQLIRHLVPIEVFSSVINSNGDQLLYEKNILRINNQIVDKLLIATYMTSLITQDNQEYFIEIKPTKIWWLIFQCIDNKEILLDLKA